MGDKKVLVGLSGGVDSSVAAVMVHKAVGDQLYCIFVDHGLLRKNEGDEVEKTFKEGFHMNFIRVDARERFMNRLRGVSDPETKRKIIGEEFIRVFEEEANKLKDIDYLVQGTVYPDVIESGTDTAQVIKSHHNVGGLPEDMQFALIEPLRDLFKDEVRALGKTLGLPDELVWRQPFPGPGLAIRIIGEALLDIINDILDFSRIEADKMELELHEFSLIQCVENAMDLVARAAAQKGLKLAHKLTPNMPFDFIGDATRLRQAALFTRIAAKS